MSENKEKGSEKQNLPKKSPKLPKVPPIKTMPIRASKDKKEKSEGAAKRVKLTGNKK